MDVILKFIGALICAASFLQFGDPVNVLFKMPLLFALGCIIFSLGHICTIIRKK